MPPRMFSWGSQEFWTPYRRAVPGISCISPRAPFGESAFGLKFDSTSMTLLTRRGSTRSRSAWRRIASSNAVAASRRARRNESVGDLPPIRQPLPMLLKMTAPPSALRISFTSARELPGRTRSPPAAQSTASRIMAGPV